MSSEVNTAQEQKVENIPEATQENSHKAVTLEGQLTVLPSGVVRTLTLLTGMAALLWLFRLLRYLVGYRHPVRLATTPTAIRLEGERLLLGLGLGQTSAVLPLSSLRRASLVARSGMRVLVVGIIAFALFAAVAVTLIMWGIGGREPSWIVGGVLVLALGAALDGGAYVLVRWRQRQGRGDLCLQQGKRRFCVARAPLGAARRLLDQIAAGARSQ